MNNSFTNHDQGQQDVEGMPAALRANRDHTTRHVVNQGASADSRQQDARAGAVGVLADTGGRDVAPTDAPLSTSPPINPTAVAGMLPGGGGLCCPLDCADGALCREPQPSCDVPEPTRAQAIRKLQRLVNDATALAAPWKDGTPERQAFYRVAGQATIEIQRLQDLDRPSVAGRIGGAG